MKKKLWNKRGLALLTAAALALSSFQPVLAAGNAVNVEARAESTVITDLKTNDLRNPVGIDTVNPSFAGRWSPTFSASIRKHTRLKWPGILNLQIWYGIPEKRKMETL